MKIVAINCNSSGNGYHIENFLDSFLLGAREEGASIERINTSDLKIEPCKGCTMEHEFESPGKCLKDDDMNNLYPQLRDADVWLFSATFEHNRPDCDLLNVLDRLEPLFQPCNFLNGDSFEQTEKKGKVVLISTSEHWSVKHFQPLVDQLSTISLMYERELLPPLLRPHTHTIDTLDYFGVKSTDLFTAARDAGRQLVRDGRISDDTINIISSDVIPNDSFIAQVSNIARSVPK
jgi:multimeric flavodoxin WrbA